MTERRVQAWPDDSLIAALRGIEPEIAWPTATSSGGGPEVAQAVRTRLDDMPAPMEGRASVGALLGLRPRVPIWRPARRAILIAIAVLIALAALAGAAGLGLPGLRLLFGGASVSPPPSLE